MKKRVAQKILDRFAADSANDYFHKHMVLDGGEKLRAEKREAYVNPSMVSQDDLVVIAKHASSLLDKELMKYNLETAKHSAVEMAVRSFSHGKYDGKIDSSNFYKIVNLMNSKTGGIMNLKLAQAITSRLDRIAEEVKKLQDHGKLDKKYAYNLQMLLDRVSDDIEKTAHKLEGDSDEKYMNDFGNDPATHEHDANEKFMTDFHNGGQNVMSDRMDKDHFHGNDLNKSAAAPAQTEKKLDASKLAEKRQK